MVSTLVSDGAVGCEGPAERGNLSATQALWRHHASCIEANSLVPCTCNAKRSISHRHPESRGVLVLE